MPNWKLTLILTYALISVPVLSCSKSNRVHIDDGHAFRVAEDDILLEYDGLDQLSVHLKSHQLSINARPPASLYISQDKRFMAYNYGDGSGQVYDLEIYILDTGKYTNLSSWKMDFLKRARTGGCSASPEDISVLFKRWENNDSYTIETEDFSRIEGCQSLAGEWQIKIDK